MIYLSKEDYKKFEVKISAYKAVQPVKILKPDGYILPGVLLNDEEVMKALPELKEMEIIKEFEPIPDEII